MSDKSVKVFLSRYHTRKIRHDQTLLYQGEVPPMAYMIKEGIIKTYNINSAGESKIITFNMAGEFIPTAWIFGKSPVSLFYYDALTDCELYAIPKEDLWKFIHSDQKILEQALTVYSSLYISATMHIHALEQSKAGEKLLYTLQHLAMRFGKPKKEGVVELTLKLTHQDLASIIGLTRETIAVELNKLKKQKVVSYRQQKYIVHVDKILQQLGEDEFRNLTI